MVISQQTFVCLDATRMRCLRGVARLWSATGSRFTRPAPVPIMTKPAVEPAAVVESAAPAADPASPPLPSDPEPAPLTTSERRARAAAVRGLLLARQRRFGPAEAAFAEAAGLDPALDLASVPTFWDLQRGGQEAAVRAYEVAGRIRDAAVLGARVRYTFRPRLVRTRPGPAAPPS